MWTVYFSDRLLSKQGQFVCLNRTLPMTKYFSNRSPRPALDSPFLKLISVPKYSLWSTLFSRPYHQAHTVTTWIQFIPEKKKKKSYWNFISTLSWKCHRHFREYNTYNSVTSNEPYVHFRVLAQHPRHKIWYNTAQFDTIHNFWSWGGVGVHLGAIRTQ